VKKKILSALALAGVFVGVAVPMSHAQRSKPTQAPSDRPNIITIMTDDQDIASLKYMPRLKRLLIDQGTTFTNHTVVFPLCCPSRSGYLSGQVGHNNNVRGNTPPEGGYGNLDWTDTLPVWLSASGYATDHLGKYPNGYDGSQHPESQGVPPGWTDWNGAVDPTTYEFYHYVLNEDGTNVKHGASEEDYQTDVLTGKATDFIKKSSDDDKSFFLDVAYLAPHWEFRPGSTGTVNPGDIEGLNSPEDILGNPPVPAPRHVGMFEGLKAPHTPSYDEKDVSDKPGFVQSTDPMSDAQKRTIDVWYQRRIESLQAVDEGIAKILGTLADQGELDNTYIIFVADNGWMQGEHRLSLQKIRAYRESSTVPLIIRGPGVARGATVTDPTSSVDIPATIADLAGATAGHPLDGMSLAPYLEDASTKLKRAVFLETSTDDAGYYGVRVGRWRYIEYNTGESELYDQIADPWELESLHADPSTKDLVAQLHDLIESFRGCAGADCVVTGVRLAKV
jgi:arylsulfatase A-like enzyme